MAVGLRDALLRRLTGTGLAVVKSERDDQRMAMDKITVFPGIGYSTECFVVNWTVRPPTALPLEPNRAAHLPKFEECLRHVVRAATRIVSVRTFDSVQWSEHLERMPAPPPYEALG